MINYQKKNIAFSFERYELPTDPYQRIITLYGQPQNQSPYVSILKQKERRRIIKKGPKRF